MQAKCNFNVCDRQLVCSYHHDRFAIANLLVHGLDVCHRLPAVGLQCCGCPWFLQAFDGSARAASAAAVSCLSVFRARLFLSVFVASCRCLVLLLSVPFAFSP